MDLTIDEVAALVRVNRMTIVRLIRRGELPGCYRVGRLWRIRPEGVQALRGLDADTTAGA